MLRFWSQCLLFGAQYLLNSCFTITLRSRKLGGIYETLRRLTNSVIALAIFCAASAITMKARQRRQSHGRSLTKKWTSRYIRQFCIVLLAEALGCSFEHETRLRSKPKLKSFGRPWNTTSLNRNTDWAKTWLIICVLCMVHDLFVAGPCTYHWGTETGGC